MCRSLAQLRQVAACGRCCVRHAFRVVFAPKFLKGCCYYQVVVGSFLFSLLKYPEKGHSNGVRPVAPVAYQVILEPGIVQFREFEPRRVHTRINSLGFFLCTN